MANITAPETAQMVDYLKVVGNLRNQIKSDLTPEAFAVFILTHNALLSGVIDAATQDDLKNLLTTNLIITA